VAHTLRERAIVLRYRCIAYYYCLAQIP